MNECCRAEWPCRHHQRVLAAAEDVALHIRARILTEALIPGGLNDAMLLTILDHELRTLARDIDAMPRPIHA